MIKKDKPFALISRAGRDYLEFFEGNIMNFETIDEIFSYHAKQGGKLLNIIPFCQMRELGFEAHGSEKIIALDIEVEKKFGFDEFFEICGKHEARIKDGSLEYEYSDEEFCEIVGRVVKNEIKEGEGSNFVISRKTFGEIEGFSLDIALSIFKNIIKEEYGYYWAYCIFTGNEFFIGATPEMYLNIKGETVSMNPVKGTYRKKGSFAEDKAGLLGFLDNKKEQNELFMVVDEELKMMAHICKDGGRVFGPFLKEMSRVIHTEYILTGESKHEANFVVKASMHAPSLVGGPFENACRIIKKYEKSSRKYYCGSLFLLDSKNHESLDGVTTIRTLHIQKDGKFEIQSGATIVSLSNPLDELLEIKAKEAGVLRAILGNFTERYEVLSQLKNDSHLLKKLSERNRELSDFWLHFATPKIFLKFNRVSRIKVNILDNEDSFTWMIFHILSQMGCDVKIISYRKYDKYEVLSDCDLVILGPGPGDPSSNEKKIVFNHEVLSEILKTKQKFIGVCLGHQIISQALGFELKKASFNMQGVQLEIDLFDLGVRKLGFYNTFIARYDEEIAKKNKLSVCRLKTDEIIALRGENFSSFQFHAESILSHFGYEVFYYEIGRVLENWFPLFLPSPLPSPSGEGVRNKM